MKGAALSASKVHARDQGSPLHNPNAPQHSAPSTHTFVSSSAKGRAQLWDVRKGVTVQRHR